MENDGVRCVQKWSVTFNYTVLVVLSTNIKIILLSLTVLHIIYTILIKIYLISV